MTTMTRHALSVVLLLCAATPCAASGQLVPGDSVRLSLMSAAKIQSRFVRSTDSTIVLRDSAFQRSTIEKIEVWKRTDAGTNLAISMTIGTAGTLLNYALTDKSERESDGYYVAFGAITTLLSYWAVQLLFPGLWHEIKSPIY